MAFSSAIIWIVGLLVGTLLIVPDTFDVGANLQRGIAGKSQVPLLQAVSNNATDLNPMGNPCKAKFGAETKATCGLLGKNPSSLFEFSKAVMNPLEDFFFMARIGTHRNETYQMVYEKSFPFFRLPKIKVTGTKETYERLASISTDLPKPDVNINPFGALFRARIGTSTIESYECLYNKTSMFQLPKLSARTDIAIYVPPASNFGVRTIVLCCIANLPSCMLIIYCLALGLKNIAQEFESTDDTPRPPPKKQIELGRKLGQGSFGQVYMARMVNSDGTVEYCAMKCAAKRSLLAMDQFHLHPERHPTFSVMPRQELETMKLVRSGPFVCQMILAFETRELLWICMENYPKSLRQVLDERFRFDLSDTQFYVPEIICAVEYLHSQDIVHRDLSLGNMMLARNGHLRIIDFGMAVTGVTEAAMIRGYCGTPEYMAPEVQRKQPYGKPCDWWSVGIGLYLLTHGYSPYPRKFKFDSRFNKEMLSFMFQLLKVEPFERLGNPCSPFGAIRNHPFVRNVDWNAVENERIEPPKWATRDASISFESRGAEPIVFDKNQGAAIKQISDMDLERHQYIFEGFEFGPQCSLGALKKC